MTAYPSRVDVWFVVVCSLTAVLMLAVGIYSLVADPGGEGWVSFVWVLMTLLLWGGLLYAVLWPCRYTLEDDHLHIQAGIRHIRIPYDKIRETSKSSSLWVAPALSLRRVRIDHSGGSVLISPVRREEFVEDLRRRLGSDA